MAFRFPDIPVATPLVTRAGLITEKWVNWLVFLIQVIQNSVTQFSKIRETGLEASLGVTPFPSGLIASGTYRVTATVRVTRPATVSSSIMVSVHGTDTVAVQFNSPTVTGNLTSTVATVTALIDATQAASLGISTTYASVGATVMQYKVTATAEAMPL